MENQIQEGLGTSTSKEAKECFKNLNDKKMVMTIEDESDEELLCLLLKKTVLMTGKDGLKKLLVKKYIWTRVLKS